MTPTFPPNAERKYELMKKNIVLCGFMGSGKSTVGKILSKKLFYRYIDMDKYIEELSGMKIPDIFKVYGEEGFRDIEHKAACSLGKLSGAVIATGGGALTFKRNIAPLSENSDIVYLNVDFETCYRRIKNSDRPLVHSNTKSELKALFEKRDAFYKRAANVVIDNPGSSEKMADAITEILQV